MNQANQKGTKGDRFTKEYQIRLVDTCLDLIRQQIDAMKEIEELLIQHFAEIDEEIEFRNATKQLDSAKL